ncbi:hypothetical protein H6F76_25755 [Leptolyngbya sp. FACHB-321]|nr:hypothetical protein [Leptolyngbya sp. FACHB-321]MBD2038362.1 hypothetical protein [Leptolyngbya sp. FACHB-321]
MGNVSDDTFSSGAIALIGKQSRAIANADMPVSRRAVSSSHHPKTVT